MNPFFYDFKLNSEKPYSALLLKAKPFQRPPDALYEDYHPEMQLNIVKRGDVSGFISRWPYKLEKNGIYITAPWEPHCGSFSKQGYTLWTIAIDPEKLSENLLSERSKLASLFLLPPRKRTELVNAPEIRKAAGKCMEEFSASADSDILKRWYILLGFFVRLVSWIKKEDLQDNPHSGLFFRMSPVFKLLNLKGHPGISVEEAAASCSLGVSRFRYLFRKLMGIPFAQFELNYRLSRAAGELLNGDLFVKEVAEKWGFYDQSHFTHIFGKKYGCSPARYCLINRKLL